jgi:uncharacterized protein (TIGR02145 family)
MGVIFDKILGRIRSGDGNSTESVYDPLLGEMREGQLGDKAIFDPILGVLRFIDKATWQYIVNNYLPSFAFGVSKLSKNIVWPFRYRDAGDTLPAVVDAKFAGNVLDVADIVSTVGALRATVRELKDQSREKRQVYGLLYNWWAAAGIPTTGAAEGTKNIAPEGYRVATNADWAALITRLGVLGYPNVNDVPNPGDLASAANALKSKRQINSGVVPNGGAGGNFNISTPPRWDADDAHWGIGNLGFDALPAGVRSAVGTFSGIGGTGGWWSSTEYSLSPTTAWGRGMARNIGNVYSANYTKRSGFSVRCCREIAGDPKDGVFIETVTDVDGNVYNGIQIGNLVWLDRNLMVTKWNDGTPIQAVTSYTDAEWAALTSAAWCHYNNLAANSWTDPSTVLIGGDRPEIDRQGLIAVERPATNHIRTSLMTGAVAGTPGTLPTNWGFVGRGLSRQVVGIGYEDNLKYIDLRMFGTTNDTQDVVIAYNTIFPAATAGQTWTASKYLKIVSAPLPPNSYNIHILGRLVGGGRTEFTSLTIAPNDELQRYNITRVLDNANTVRADTNIIFGITVSTAYDFTIRIAAPQLELGSYPTNHIGTSGSVITRPAPQVVLPFLLPRTGYVAGMVDAVSDGGITRIFQAGDTGTTNLTDLWHLAANNAIRFISYGSSPPAPNNAVSINDWFLPTTGARNKFGFIAVWRETGSDLYLTDGTRHFKATNAGTVVNEDNFRSVQLGRNVIANTYSSVKYHALTTGLQTSFTDQQAAKLLSELSQGFLNIPPTITFS